MSVTNANLPVLIIQLPHVAKVSAMDQYHPELQAALAEELAKRHAEKRRKTVQGAEKTDAIKQLKKEDEEQTEQQAAGKRRHEESAEEEEVMHSTPWSGNIINTKI